MPVYDWALSRGRNSVETEKGAESLAWGCFLLLLGLLSCCATSNHILALAKCIKKLMFLMIINLYQ